MSLLKQLIQKISTNNNLDLSKELAPLLASDMGRVFSGMYLEDIEFLLRLVEPSDLVLKTDNQLLDFFAQQRVYYFESLAMQLIAVTCRSEKVALTDAEFQKIKDEAPSLVGNKTKERFVAYINKDPNQFAAKILEFVPVSKLLPVREINNPLYAFVHELTATSQVKLDDLRLNTRVFGDAARVATLMHELKTVKRDGVPLLDARVTTKGFSDSIYCLFTINKLTKSLFPNTLVMEFNGILRDYTEAEFQNQVVSSANFYNTVMHSFVAPNVGPSRQKMLEESSNPLYKYLHLLLSNSQFCSHGNLLANDEIISDYNLINVVLKDLKEKTRVTKDGKEIKKLDPSINELQFVDILKKVCKTNKIRCSINSSDKLIYNVNGVMRDLGELTLTNHIIFELNKLVLESPQYPPVPVHSASTSLSSSSSTSTTATAVVPPAVAGVVLSSNKDGISKI